MLVERIDEVKRCPAASGALGAQNKRRRDAREFDHLRKPRGNAIRGLAIGAVVSLGLWVALGVLIWALTRS